MEIDSGYYESIRMLSLEAENAALKAENEGLRGRFEKDQDRIKCQAEQLVALKAQEPVATVVRGVHGTLGLTTTENLVHGMKLYTVPQPTAVPAGWKPIETAPRNGLSRLYKINGFCVQGFIDVTGTLMVQNEISPHWRIARGKPTHWMPLPAAPEDPQAQDKDGERYRWLRQGANDEAVLIIASYGAYLPRLERLDAAIDQAMKE